MKVVFTNGVFDIIHRGHIELLRFCKQQGDRLVVGIDSDARVRQTKGMTRPINSQEDRKFVLESLRWVDSVVIFDSIEELRDLHHRIQPDVVVKGSDWDEVYIRSMDGICAKSELLLYPLVEGYSTTNTIEKSKCS